MSNTIGSKSAKTNVFKNQNTIETLKNVLDSPAKTTSGGLDQLFGNYEDNDSFEGLTWNKEVKKPVSQQRKEFSIFSYQNYYETEIVKKQIKELSDQIKREIDLIKKADTALQQEVKEVENLTLEALPEKPGIYHIRFFEIVLSLLNTIRAKIGESRTWMQAMVSKRKKRGSLFAARSKKQGTQYSLSQELSSARSVQ